MTFSKAMKNMQPLDVTPMLGSAPSSPTSLKVKLRGKSSSSTLKPSGPVTKVVGIGGSSDGGRDVSSF
jgi:hypothetical protein